MDKVMIASRIGLGAAILSSICPIPQVFKALKTKSVSDISIYAQGIGLVSSSLFLTYGILLNLWPIMASNALHLICCGTLVLMKVRSKSVRMSSREEMRK